MNNIKPEDLIKLVDSKVSMIKALERYNPSGYYQAGKPCFCPFHDNHNTPAAALYDNDGEQSLWCFSEQKLYKSSDVLEKLLNQNVYSIGEQLWLKMDPLEQSEFLSKVAGQDYLESFSKEILEGPEKIDEGNKQLSNKKELFKLGKITYKELLAEIDKLLG